MPKVINFKKSQYFVFKKHLEAACGGIAIHTKESFNPEEYSLNYGSSSFKEDGYVVLFSSNISESECDLFLKYSPEGKLIEFRLLYCYNQEWVGWYKDDNITDPFKKEGYLITACEVDRDQNNLDREKPYKLLSRKIDSIETNKDELILECQNAVYPKNSESDDKANEYLHIKCESGTYDIYEVDCEKQFYGWIGYLKKNDEDKPEFKFMFES